MQSGRFDYYVIAPVKTGQQKHAQNAMLCLRINTLHGSFVESHRLKNIPATALIQLEFLFIDGIQRCQLIFCPNPNPKICSTYNVAGAFFSNLSFLH